ncbi:MAG: cell wall-binding repeat-containing protein [Actinobacteria bacterium]|nr:cell wall-binding repeat-containing protein [Actinomycetota bacterium]
MTLVLAMLLVAAVVATPAPALADHARPPDDLWRPDPSDVPDETTYVYLESTPGDVVGQGAAYSYDPTNAAIYVRVEGEGVRVDVAGYEHWSAYFVGPSERLEEGYYHGLRSYYGHDPAVGGLLWQGGGYCHSEVYGWFVVDEVSYSTDGVLARLRLRFEQHCGDQGSPPLNGEIAYDAANAAPRPPNPRPSPPDLWEPDPAALPGTTTFAYLESEVGDWIGGGATYRYPSSYAGISAYIQSPPHLRVEVHGNEDWRGDFRLPTGQEQIEPGWYAELGPYWNGNPVTGGLAWSGESRSCSDIVGWFAVDEYTIGADNRPARLRLRFEQRCHGADSPALRGLIVYDASDPSEPSPNPRPIPDGLWQPEPADVPEGAATFVHLESEPGDSIGVGGTYSYRTSDAELRVTGTGTNLSISVGGDERWNGTFAGKSQPSAASLEPGLYDELQGTPGHNGKLGGLRWSGEGRYCAAVYGWFAVEHVTYDAIGLIHTLRLRFEQRCDDPGAPTLRGLIVYDGASSLEPSLNPRPIPDGLWEPDPDELPERSNFVHLESAAGDHIGEGRNYDYHAGNAAVGVVRFDSGIDVRVSGQQHWTANFRGVNGERIEPGLYADLHMFPYHNYRLGGLSWDSHRTCNDIDGWFAVDEATYSPDGQIVTLRLRFEQRCDRSPDAPLHGLIVYDATAPPDPPTNPRPQPDGLWEPDPSSLPDAATFVHLESGPGDHIGSGASYDYHTGTAAFTVHSDGPAVSVQLWGNERWLGRFSAPDSLGRLEEGFYDHREPLGPLDGGLRWSGLYQPSCGSYRGWFVVEEVSYEADASLATLRLRFEQRCDISPDAVLRGVLVYDAAAPPEPSPNPGPLPDGLWEPDPEDLPAGAATFVHLESESGDYIGQGRTYDYRTSTANLTVTPRRGEIGIRVIGDEEWLAGFVGPDTMVRLEPGYYGDLIRSPLNSPPLGGLFWRGERRGCDTLTGWFALDDISYSSDTSLQTLRLRFEQRCGTSPGSVLRGLVVFDASAPIEPPANPRPIPADLWQPAPTDLPAGAATFVHLESSPGDTIGGGRTYDYGTGDAVLEVKQEPHGRVSVVVRGDERWEGSFLPPALYPIQEGYYAELQYWGNAPNPRLGSLAWSGPGHGCVDRRGWFAVDDIEHDLDGHLLRLRLRFEQSCFPGGPPLRGVVGYDATVPLEPSVNPEPAPLGLWEPDPEDLPDAATFIHLESAPGDPIGSGRTWNHTLADSAIEITSGTGVTAVQVTSATGWWDGDFALPNDEPALRPGYYASLKRFPAWHNPRKGGLAWAGNGRSCTTLDGWYVVDSVVFGPSGIERLRLRFEQRCGQATAPPLRGLIVYNHPELALPSLPDTYLGPGPPARTTADSATFTFGSATSAVTFRCRLDGGAWEPCTSPRSYRDLAAGAHTFTVRAVDADGWTDDSPATWTWWVQRPPDGGEVPADDKPADPGDVPDPGGLPATKPTTVRVLGGLEAVDASVVDVVAELAAWTSGSARRIGGSDRYATAAAVVADAFPDTVEVVYLATGREFPDALAGAAAATRVGAPVLLTDGTWLPAATLAELARLRPSIIKVLGGPQAVSDAVLAQIAEATGTPPIRVGGPDRYATAAATVADAFPATADTVYLATGREFPDALAGAAVASHVGAPVLLTEPASLPAATATELARLRPKVVKVLGGMGAISDAVLAQVAAVTGVHPTRIWGVDRYATAAATVADAFAGPVSDMYVATGASFPDALAGAAAAGHVGAPLLLTEPHRLPDITAYTLWRLLS